MLGDPSLFFDGALGSPPPIIDASPPPSALFPDVAGGAPAYLGPFDRWGAIQIPLRAPEQFDAIGDPGLSTLILFLKAFLTTDGNATALWNAYGVAPGMPAVRTARPWNPSDAHGDHQGQGFVTSDLPAMYAWRDDFSHERIADEWLVDTSTIKLLWVFPKAVQSSQRVRQPFSNAMQKLVAKAIERGRTPSFRVAGDPDRYAATEGSFVHTFINAIRIRLTVSRPTRVTVENDAQRDYFPALEMTVMLEENLERGIEQFVPNHGTEITITAPNGDVLEHLIVS